MKYELKVKPGIDTPPFVFEEGAQPFETRINNPHRPNFGEAIKISVLWIRLISATFAVNRSTCERGYAENTVVCERRTHLREFHEQRNAFAKNS